MEVIGKTEGILWMRRLFFLLFYSKSYHLSVILGRVAGEVTSFQSLFLCSGAVSAIRGALGVSFIVTPPLSVDNAWTCVFLLCNVHYLLPISCIMVNRRTRQRL